MQPIDFFLRGARLHAGRPAAVDLQTGETVVYADLRERVFAIACAFQALTGKQRPTVATLADNSLDVLTGILATYACGGALVPLTPTVVESDIARQLQHAQPDILLHDPQYEPLTASFGGLRCRTGATGGTHMEGLTRQYRGAAPERAAARLDDISAIKFTGGSSGIPKAVLQSFRCLNTMVASLIMVYGFDERERFLVAPPMTHGAGTFVLPVLASGGSLVIANKASAPQLHQALQEQRVTSTWVPPTLLHKLVEAQRSTPASFPALRNLLYGGAPCPAALLERAIAAFGPVLGVTYGLTEAPVIIAGMDGEHGSLPENRGSAGCVGPLTRVAVLDKDGRPNETPNVAGEIIARGDLLMLGYLGMPEKTAEVMLDGWFRTGDIGYIDGRGYLFIKGRSKDVIITGGFNVYPSEVEEVYSMHEGVAECMVFGVPDEVWGERVEMAVVPARKESLQPEALIAFGKERLGSVRTPKVVHFVDFFPKNALGKIDKRTMMESLRGGTRQEEQQQ